MFLLKIETTNSLLLAASSTETAPFLDLLLKGGWVMLPILLLSILTVYAIVERLIVLHSASKIPRQWIDAITTKTIEGDTQGVWMLCEQKHYAIASIIKVGIENSHKSMETIERVIANAGQMELHKLEKNLALLGTIAGAAPMLGFLGTVIGMIQAFMAMAQETTQISPKLLSGGIYEAMVTTAAGLVVGIMANLGYNYLLTRIQKTTHRIEYAANHFIEIMGSQTKLKQHSEIREA